MPGSGIHLARHLVVAVALAGCGPVGYLRDVAGDASRSVEEARALNAAKHAPYWWTRAVAYLHQARAEAARADFEAANRFGRIAAEAAAQATREARLADGSAPVAPPTSAPPAHPEAEVPPAPESRR